MSWLLEVFAPSDTALATPLISASPTNPYGLQGDVHWATDGLGTLHELRFSAVPSLMVALPARGYVKYTPDSGISPVYGYLTQTWRPNDNRLVEYVVTGLYDLLAQTVMDSRTYSGYDVAFVADSILLQLLPPPLTESSADLVGSAMVTMGYSAGVKLTQILDALAKWAGPTYRWWIDGLAVHLGVPSGTQSVGYLSQGLEWLPIQGRDTVTSVDLLCPLPSHVQDSAPHSYTIQRYGGVDTVAVYPANSSSDPTYHAQRAFVVPFNPWIWARIPLTVTPSGWVALVNATDSSLTTYAIAPGGVSSTAAAEVASPVFGLRVLAAASGAYPLNVSVTYNNHDGSSLLLSYAGEMRLSQDSGVQAIVMLYPYGVYNSAATTLVSAYAAPTGTDTVRLYDIQALTLDHTLLAQYAASLMRLPAASPASIKWPRLVEGTPQITITGTPDGTLTGDVVEWDYIQGPSGTYTMAKMGTADYGPEARAIRIISDSRRDEAIMSAVQLGRS